MSRLNFGQSEWRRQRAEAWKPYRSDRGWYKYAGLPIYTCIKAHREELLKVADNTRGLATCVFRESREAHLPVTWAIVLGWVARLRLIGGTITNEERRKLRAVDMPQHPGTTWSRALREDMRQRVNMSMPDGAMLVGAIRETMWAVIDRVVTNPELFDHEIYQRLGRMQPVDWYTASQWLFCGMRPLSEWTARAFTSLEMGPPMDAAAANAESKDKENHVPRKEPTASELQRTQLYLQYMLQVQLELRAFTRTSYDSSIVLMGFTPNFGWIDVFRHYNDHYPISLRLDADEEGPYVVCRLRCAGVNYFVGLPVMAVATRFGADRLAILLRTELGE